MDIEKKNEEINYINNSIKKLNDLIQSYQTDLKNKDIYDKVNEISLIKQNLLNDKTKAELMLNKLKEVSILEEEVKKHDADILLKEEDFKTKTEIYTKNYNLYLLNQAGILASALKNECACPVCGSHEHPNPASLDREIISESELDKCKQIAEEAKELLLSIRNKKEIKVKLILSIKNEIDFDLINNYENKCKELIEIDDKIKKLNLIKETYQKALNGNEKANKELHYENKRINLVKHSLSELQKKSAILETKIAELTKNNDGMMSIDLINKLVSEQNELIKNLNQSILNIEKDNQENKLLINTNEINLKNNYELIENNKKELENIEKNLNNIEIPDFELIDKIDLPKVKKEITDYQVAKEVLVKTINENQNYENKELIDISELTLLKEQLRFETDEAQAKYNIIFSRYQNKIKLYSKIKEISVKLENLEKEAVSLISLSQTANGTLNGKSKIAFEQFVQATYFKQVLDAANERLHLISENRYMLIQKEEAKNTSDKIGIDLEVIDNYNSSRRDVKSLSGGESFMAALSLALGLSDVIQSYAGGISVETLFIDEGFGTLDAESLEKALGVLSDLSLGSHLIGIISHVPELKTRIDKQIKVSKSREGSKIEVSSL